MTFAVIIVMRTDNFIRPVTLMFTDREAADSVYWASREALNTVSVHLTQGTKEIQSDLGLHYSEAVA